jgi:hypothetical protein
VRARRLILIIVGTIGVTSFFLSFPYFYRLRDSSPRSPLPATQQCTSLAIMAIFLMFRGAEYWLFHGLVYGGWSLGALTAVLNYRWKVIHNLTPQDGNAQMTTNDLIMRWSERRTAVRSTFEMTSTL